MLLNLYYFFIFAQLCAVCLCDSSSTNIFQGYTYNDQINGWLKLHSRPDDWLAARISCNMEGATLVLPWTADFTNAVNEIQASHGVTTSLYSGVHITQTAYYDGLYGYVGDVPSMLIEPSHTRLKLCGVFTGDGSMSEVDCKQQLPYVCFKPEIIGAAKDPSSRVVPHTPVAPPTPTPLPEPSCGGVGYEYWNKTGHCYKFHPSIVNWTTGKATCQSEGARLAVPNSVDEAKIITTIHGRYLDTDLLSSQSNYYPDWVSVGIFYENGAYTTTDGVPLHEAGYMQWSGGKPTDYPTTWPYVVMNRGGKLATTRDPGYPFICEKAPAKA